MTIFRAHTLYIINNKVQSHNYDKTLKVKLLYSTQAIVLKILEDILSIGSTNRVLMMFLNDVFLYFCVSVIMYINFDIHKQKYLRLYIGFACSLGKALMTSTFTILWPWPCQPGWPCRRHDVPSPKKMPPNYAQFSNTWKKETENITRGFPKLAVG